MDSRQFGNHALSMSHHVSLLQRNGSRRPRRHDGRSGAALGCRLHDQIASNGGLGRSSRCGDSVQHELELIIALTSVCIEPVAATAKRMPKDDPVNIGEKQLGKSAFEIPKGTRQVMTLSEREVESI